MHELRGNSAIAISWMSADAEKELIMREKAPLCRAELKSFYIQDGEYYTNWER